MPTDQSLGRCQTCLNDSGWIFEPPEGIDLRDVHPAIVPYITTLMPCPACNPPPEPSED